MLRFIFSRLSLVIPTFFGVMLLSFGLIHAIPGDPVEIRHGQHAVSPEEHARAMHELGLDRSLPIQFVAYIGDVLSGDLGKSISHNDSVFHEFVELFPATVELSFAAMLFAVLLGIPMGMLAATKRNSPVDHAVMGTALVGYSMPIFWWGLLLILFFSVHLHWTPVDGRIDVQYYFPAITGFMTIDALFSGQPGAFRSALSHLLLPTIVLGTIPLAVIARMTRSSMLEVLNEDYIRTARAKGLSSGRVVVVHALRNALIPVVTVIGLLTGQLLAGAILTETIFAWPGVGHWLVESIQRRDYPALQGGVLLISCLVIVVNLSVDLLYGVLNPRIRHKR
ncbi:MAG TPA: ABC transporter permease subunit [Dongiaceae bacterium]|jgi:dipeptide transport system permease protein|nr:ABC transporter permease subunit [Dongiaceae bacterium]